VQRKRKRFGREFWRSCEIQAKHVYQYEYFTVGHDDVATIFEPDMFKAFAPDEGGFLLSRRCRRCKGGVTNFAVISESERLKGSPERKYSLHHHDISKSALARNMVFGCVE